MKRKYLVGVPLWNCLDMVPWILEGCARLDPSRVFLLFLFSNVPQETKDNFWKAKGIINGFKWASMSTDKDLREGQNHNILMQYLLDSDRDVLLAPQDDNQFQSGRILDDLDSLYDLMGDKIGVIGGRDGYGYQFADMVGSAWSNSIMRQRILPEGQIAERPLVNTGPFAYSRHTIQTVGLNNDQPIFSFEDYCLRCIQAGKTNIVLGTNMKHEKFGRGREMCNSGPLVANDLRRLQDTWVAKIGHIVHG